MQRRLADSISVVAKGFCMGAADVVPGVSGGTMAFILGIYTRLIDAIKSFDAKWVGAIFKFDLLTMCTRPHLGFLIPLAIGIASALVFFTQVVPIPKLLHTHPEQVYGVFFGLILGSIFILMIDLGWRSIKDGLALVLGIVLGAIVVTSVPSQTPDTWWFIMLAGAIAICAMVLPGISGSFILLILGKYAHILNGIGTFNLAIVIPFAVGAAFGLAGFTRILSWLLHRFERQMLMIISGFLIASLWIIWPFQQRQYVTVRGKQRLLESNPIVPEWSTTALEACTLAAIGFAAVITITRFANRPSSAAR